MLFMYHINGVFTQIIQGKARLILQKLCSIGNEVYLSSHIKTEI